MPAPTSSKSPGSAKYLIDAMTDSRALSVFVQRMDPHTLKTLVEDVGLEDAGPLIEHVSSDQLVQLLDETIWTGAKPGDPDKLSVAELLRWLDLWNGLGSGFVADKLFALGDDFCALAFSRLLVIADSDLAPRVLDEHSYAIGTFVVRVRVDDEWDTVQTAISALWRDYPDFAEAVFSRLAFRHSTLKMFGEDDTAQVLDADAGYAHEQGREQAGYVTSIMAGGFLRALQEADVDALAAEAEYDLQTQEYFRRREQLRRHAAAAASAEAAVRAEDSGSTDSAGNAGKAETSTGSLVDDEELAELSARLQAYERYQSRASALLTGPETASVQESDWVRVALGRLQSEPEPFDRRMDELSYLANLLLVGTESGGERLESAAAANLVIATCNLGASHDLWLAEVADPAAEVLEMLRNEPGLVRLFRIGWHLLAGLPREAAACLTAVFADDAVRTRLGAKPWVLTEVDALLTTPDFQETVAGRAFEDAGETLKILGIALEPEAVVVLCMLTDGVPKFARVLEDRPPEGAVMTYAARNLTTMSDLMTVHRFLDGLADQVRL